MCEEESYILTRKAELHVKFDSFMCAQLGIRAREEYYHRSDVFILL